MSMTESEARSRLSYLKSKAENALSNTNSNCEWAKKDVEGTILALDMAITALEEIQQYRAIGTVSEFRELEEKSFVDYDEHYTDNGECLVTISDALSIVSEVEAEYGNGWIDVKDRLPEKDGYYLTCDHKGNIHVFYHHPSYVTNGINMAFGIGKNHSQYYQPIAWMELPKPYNRLERK